MLICLGDSNEELASGSSLCSSVSLEGEGMIF